MVAHWFPLVTLAARSRTPALGSGEYAILTTVMFYIGFKSGPRMDADGWRHAIGGIELGAESDSFAADLGTWSPQDYEAQWREAIARLAAGQPSSALVTSYCGPRAGYHSMWPMWRIKDQVVFHEQLVPGDVVAPAGRCIPFLCRGR